MSSFSLGCILRCSQYLVKALNIARLAELEPTERWNSSTVISVVDLNRRLSSEEPDIAGSLVDYSLNVC